MALITITNLTETRIPVDSLIGIIPASSTISKVVTIAGLEASGAALASLQDAGYLTFVVEDSFSTTNDTYEGATIAMTGSKFSIEATAAGAVDVDAIPLSRTRYDASTFTGTINAPAGPQAGDRFGIKEVGVDPTPVAVSGNGSNIEHPLTRVAAATVTFGRSLLGAEWEFDGSSWNLISSTGPIEIFGSVETGDVAGTIGALIVHGDITSASAITPGANQQTITVNFPTLPALPVVTMMVESRGVVNDDNDLEEPVILVLTASSLQVFLHESNSNTQNLELHFVLKVN